MRDSIDIFLHERSKIGNHGLTRKLECEMVCLGAWNETKGIILEARLVAGATYGVPSDMEHHGATLIFRTMRLWASLELGNRLRMVTHFAFLVPE